jgi:hypothetical protein
MSLTKLLKEMKCDETQGVTGVMPPEISFRLCAIHPGRITLFQLSVNAKPGCIYPCDQVLVCSLESDRGIKSVP